MGNRAKIFPFFPDHKATFIGNRALQNHHDRRPQRIAIFKTTGFIKPACNIGFILSPLLQIIKQQIKYIFFF